MMLLPGGAWVASRITAHVRRKAPMRGEETGMAKAKKGKTKAGTKPARRAAAQKPKKAARSTGGGPLAAAQKRVAALEAENRRLRDELAALRAEGAARPAPAPAPAQGGGQAGPELLGELVGLGIDARGRVARLAEGQVAEPDVGQHGERPRDRGVGREELRRLLDRHGEHVGDRAAGVTDGERLLRVAPPAARVAVDVDVGEEAHPNAEPSLARARLAAAARDVEREAAGAEATDPRLRHPGDEPADVVEETHVGGRRRARRAADRALVDLDHACEVLGALEPPVRTHPPAVQAEGPAGRLVEDVAHQRRFARAGHAGHARPRTEREGDVDVAQVVLARAAHGEARQPIEGAARPQAAAWRVQ